MALKETHQGVRLSAASLARDINQGNKLRVTRERYVLLGAMAATANSPKEGDPSMTEVMTRIEEHITAEYAHIAELRRLRSLLGFAVREVTSGEGN